MGEGLVLRVFPMVCLEELQSKHLIRSFLTISACCGIALPPYQVLQFTPFTKEPMSHDGLDLVIPLFSIDHLGRGLMEIDPDVPQSPCIVLVMRRERHHERFQGSAGGPADKRQVTLA